MMRVSLICLCWLVTSIITGCDGADTSPSPPADQPTDVTTGAESPSPSVPTGTTARPDTPGDADGPPPATDEGAPGNDEGDDSTPVEPDEGNEEPPPEDEGETTDERPDPAPSDNAGAGNEDSPTSDDEADPGNSEPPREDTEDGNGDSGAGTGDPDGESPDATALPEACDGTNDGALCDDGSLCTSEDTCVNGGCVGTPTECSANSAICITTACEPSSGECVDAIAADACYIDGVCVLEGELQPGATCMVCDVETAQTSWTARPDAAECQSADGCIENATCVAGLCVGTAVVCDDSDPCTVDACVAGVCAFDPVEAGIACDDSDPCTVADACGAGGCVGEPLDCSDDDPCTINEECVAGVCTASAEQDGTSCVGSNGCDFDGTCLQGVCEPSTTLCDDFNPCTVDGCQDNTCIYEPATDLLACEDGLSCTETGQCYAGQCIADDVNCDDDDPCTDDSCSEAEGGCIHVAVAGCGVDAAPPFSLEDMNPYSASTGEEVSLATFTNKVVVVAFYSPS